MPAQWFAERARLNRTLQMTACQGGVQKESHRTTYRVGVSRTAANLAALASSAVSGLDPVAVRAATERPGNRFDTGFVTDTQRRTWVVRVPNTSVAGAELDTAADLLALLTRRLPFGVPTARGFMAVPEGRAVVYTYLHGRSVELAEVAPGRGIAAEIGRALAALHNVEREIFDEAGVPVYDAETYRSRHLADLDRAAGTGQVPAPLLSRWEGALEDVSMWRFAPTPVHGDLRGSRILVRFVDAAPDEVGEEEASSPVVRAITGWERAKVADPADDFAVLARECQPEAYDSIFEAYSVARIERPDRHLRPRARLASELRLLSDFLDAVTAARPELIRSRAAQLKTLEEQTAGDPGLVPAGPSLPNVPTPHGATAAPSDRSAAAEHSSIQPAERSAPAGTVDQDTQPLKTGAAADATTVISEDDLAQARATAPKAEGGWYQVVEAVPTETKASGETLPAEAAGSEGIDTRTPREAAEADATTRD